MGKKFTSEYQPKKNGRPKGSLSIKTLIQQVWSEEIVDDEGNAKIKALLSIKAMVDKAESGDVHAFKALAERIEGMPKQEIDHTMKEYLLEDYSELTAEELEKRADDLRKNRST